MKKTIIMAAIMAAISFLAACGDKDDPAEYPVETEDIREVVWKLYGYGTASGTDFHKVEPKLLRDSIDDPVWNDRFIITLNTGGMISGFTAANELYGEYDIKEDKIKIIRVGMTKGGEPEVYEEEADFFIDALRSIDYEPYKVKNGQLILYFNNQQNYLCFYKRES